MNKQGDNIQPWTTPFPLWNQSVVACPDLSVASWPTYRFLKRQLRWSGIPISLRIFYSLLWSIQSKVWRSQWSSSRCFSGTLYFDDPTDVGNLISSSSAFSKSSLNIWKFMVDVLLKPGLENFELKHSLKDFKHNLASMWHESNCTVVWAFFGIAFLWDWNENLSSSVATAEFSKFANIECSTLTASAFKIFK